MGVMTAGVHSAGDLGGIGQTSFLLDGKGIKIRPEGNMGAGKVSRDPDGNAPLALSDIGKVQLLQFIAKICRGPILLKD